MKKTIILDTNFLLIPGQFGLDIFDRFHQDLDFPYALAVLDLSLLELEELEKATAVNRKNKLAVKIAQKLVTQHHLKIIKANGSNTDDELLDLSKKGYVIATQDATLIKRIKADHGKVIQMRQKKYLRVV